MRVHPPVIVPADSLITRSQGTQVAVVRDNTVHLPAGGGGPRLWRSNRDPERSPGGDLVVMTPTTSRAKAQKSRRRFSIRPDRRPPRPKKVRPAMPSKSSETQSPATGVADESQNGS